MASPTGASRTLKPIHPFFISLGGALLMAALFSDTMYSSNALMQWANFSAWLITGGLVLALVAAIVLLIEIGLHRTGPIRWFDFAVMAIIVLLSLANVFVHTRDGWTSVVPDGITLSCIVTILLIVAGLRGWRVTVVSTDYQGDRI